MLKCHKSFSAEERCARRRTLGARTAPATGTRSFVRRPPLAKCLAPESLPGVRLRRRAAVRGRTGRPRGPLPRSTARGDERANVDGSRQDPPPAVRRTPHARRPATTTIGGGPRRSGCGPDCPGPSIKLRDVGALLALALANSSCRNAGLVRTELFHPSGREPHVGWSGARVLCRTLSDPVRGQGLMG